MRKPQIPARFLGAFKAGHRVSTREFIEEELSYELLNKIIDSNWTDQESIDQLDYLTRFNNEFERGQLKKNDEKAIHQSGHDCYTRNNKRNTDIMSKKGIVDYIDDLKEEKTYGNEDTFLDFIQLKIDGTFDSVIKKKKKK